MQRVVDTNVAKVANGREINATPSCQLAALSALESLLQNGAIVMDLAGEIFGEYRRHFNSNGQPGVGDRFFQIVLTEFSGKRVLRVQLERRADGSYVDFPSDPDLAHFDPSDRKFAAAARKTNSPVLNATDSDWLDHFEALERNGITVEFVCGRDKLQWHLASGGHQT